MVPCNDTVQFGSWVPTFHKKKPTSVLMTAGPFTPSTDDTVSLAHTDSCLLCHGSVLAWHKAHHSPKSTGEARSMWSSTPTSPYIGTSYFLSYSDLFLPTHCRWRGAMVHLITLRHTPQSVGLLWTRDRPNPGTSTWQHRTLTRDRHPCPRKDSNPQAQQASGLRLTP
jgi:hypothetical protein